MKVEPHIQGGHMAEMFTLRDLIMRYPHLGQGLSQAEKEALQHEREKDPQESSLLQGFPEMAVTDGDSGADTSPLLPEEDPVARAEHDLRSRFICPDPEC